MTGKVARMTAQPAGRPELAEPYEVIHLGGKAAAVVPLAELRRLRAVERHASPEALPLGGLVRDRTKTSWPSYSAAISEDRVEGFPAHGDTRNVSLSG
jgi:hypothetical protein